MRPRGTIDRRTKCATLTHFPQAGSVWSFRLAISEAWGRNAGLQDTWFARFARSESIRDRTLAKAIANSERGLIDAVLGGGLIKLRIARPGAGKRGGSAIHRCAHGHRAVFLLGFAKSARDNIAADQLAGLKEAASALLALSDDDIAERLMPEPLRRLTMTKTQTQRRC